MYNLLHIYYIIYYIYYIYIVLQLCNYNILHFYILHFIKALIRTKYIMPTNITIIRGFCKTFWCTLNGKKKNLQLFINA